MTERSNNAYLLTGIAFLILIAPIRIGGSLLLGQALYYGILGVIICFLVFFLLRGRKIAITALLVAIFSAFFVTQSILVSQAPIVPKDFFDILRPLIYFGLFAVGYIGLNDLRAFKPFLWYLTLLFAVQVLFSATVYIDQLAVLQDIYKGRTSEDTLLKHYYRFSGTFGFPGSFGAVISIFCIWFFVLSCRTRSFWHAFLFLLFSLGLVMTGSRGALIVCIPMVLVLVLMYRLYFPSLLIIVLGSSFTFWFFMTYEIDLHALNYILEFLEKGIDEGSLTYRVNELELAMALLRDSYLYGVGPNNFYFEGQHGPIESLYLNYLGRFGLVGGLVVFGFSFIFARAFLKFRHPDLLLGSFIHVFGLWLGFSVLIGGISTSILDQLKISALVFILTGVIVKFIRLSKQQGI